MQKPNSESKKDAAQDIPTPEAPLRKIGIYEAARMSYEEITTELLARAQDTWRGVREFIDLPALSEQSYAKLLRAVRKELDVKLVIEINEDERDESMYPFLVKKKERVPETSPQERVPTAISDETNVTSDKTLEVLDTAKLIADVEACLEVPHPREAYLESIIAYLSGETDSPPPYRAELEVRDIRELLEKEEKSDLLPRFKTLRENMKMVVPYLRGAIEYLRAPTNSIADINKHAMNIGNVWILPPRHPAVEAIHRHFLELKLTFHRAAFNAAKSPEKPQDMIQFLASSYQPLAQLRLQFERDGVPERVREIDDMLAHEMRLKEGVQLPVGGLEAPETAQLTTDAETFLASGALTHPVDIKFLQRAIEFLQSPTDNFNVIKDRAADIGQVLGSFIEETPPVLDALNAYFMRLLFDYRFEGLKAAVAAEPQDIKRIMDSMRKAEEAAKRSDPAAKQAFEAFLQAYELRPKDVKTAK